MKIKQEKQFLVSVEKFKGIFFSLPYYKLLSSYFGIKRKNRAQFRYGLVVFIDSALDYQLSPFFLFCSFFYGFLLLLLLVLNHTQGCPGFPF